MKLKNYMNLKKSFKKNLKVIIFLNLIKKWIPEKQFLKKQLEKKKYKSLKEQERKVKQELNLIKEQEREIKQKLKAIKTFEYQIDLRIYKQYLDKDD